MCDLGKITGGITGWQRQEFRELALLDYITKLRFQGKLKDGVGGNTRSALIKSWQTVYKGFCPKDVHALLRWDTKDSLIPQEDDDTFVWQKIGTEAKTTKPAQKRKRENDDDHHDIDAEVPTLKNDVITSLKAPSKKKQKTKADMNDKVRGLEWTANTWSCAYDSVLTILSNVYFTNVHQWHLKAAPANAYLTRLTEFW
ncbi:hypothetical protein DENSPDRAFT_788148, partial [Dentipellis sp. KUC8613]